MEVKKTRDERDKKNTSEAARQRGKGSMAEGAYPRVRGVRPRRRP